MLHDIAATVDAIFDVLRVLVPDLIVARLLYGLGRFLLLSRQAKRHYPAALWGRFRHRWLMRNLGLAYLDEHRKTVKPIPLGTSHSVALAGRPNPGCASPRVLPGRPLRPGGQAAHDPEGQRRRD